MLDEYVLVSDHHLHPGVVHEVFMMAVERCAVFVVEELCKLLSRSRCYVCCCQPPGTAAQLIRPT
jgi:hypothetical protein